MLSKIDFYIKDGILKKIYINQHTGSMVLNF